MVKIFCDGASKGNPGPASLGVWATNESGNGNSGEPVFELSRAIGVTTNNEAEWQSLLEALREAKKRGIQNVEVFMDSQLVVYQVNGIYKVKKPEFKPYWNEVNLLRSSFSQFRISHLPREQNRKADALANQAL